MRLNGKRIIKMEKAIKLFYTTCLIFIIACSGKKDRFSQMEYYKYYPDGKLMFMIEFLTPAQDSMRCTQFYKSGMPEVSLAYKMRGKDTLFPIIGRFCLFYTPITSLRCPIPVISTFSIALDTATYRSDFSDLR